MTIADFMDATLPFLTWIGAASLATVGFGILWDRIFGPLLGMTLLKEVNSDLREVKQRLAAEFSNGVSPDSRDYMPLRKRLDVHIEAESERWRRHDEEALGVRKRLDEFNMREN